MGFEGGFRKYMTPRLMIASVKEPYIYIWKLNIVHLDACYVIGQIHYMSRNGNWVVCVHDTWFCSSTCWVITLILILFIK